MSVSQELRPGDGLDWYALRGFHDARTGHYQPNLTGFDEQGIRIYLLGWRAGRQEAEVHRDDKPDPRLAAERR